jgi:hypothetical protein
MQGNILDFASILKSPINQVFAACAVVFALMHTSVGEQLRLMSIDQIRFIRNTQVVAQEDLVTNVLGGCSENYFLELVLIASYCFLSQTSAMTLTLVNAVVAALNPMIKMLFRSSRPWFEDQTYVPLVFDFEYGMVSGHSFRGASFYLTLAFLAFRDYKITNGILKTVVYGIICVLSLQFGYSRLIMGLHTLDQIIAGFSLGVMVFITFCHFFRNHFEDLWVAMAEDSKSLINNSAIYLLIILNATALAVLAHHDSNFSIDVKWTMITEDQILRVKTASSIKLFTSTILLGAYAGLLVQRQLFSEEIEPEVIIDRIDMRPLKHFGFLQM